MTRKISVERTYALKQYENIKLYDEIILPDELAFDDVLIGKLRKLQFIKLEMDFRNYVNLFKELLPYNIGDVTIILNELRDNLIDEVNTTLENNNTKGDNENDS